MAVVARLKNEFMEDGKCHKLMSSLKCWCPQKKRTQSHEILSRQVCLYLVGKSEPSHEIMALFILSKLILQTRMHSHPVGLLPYSPKPSLVAYVISTIISWAGSLIKQPYPYSDKKTWAGPWENVSYVICEHMRKHVLCHMRTTKVQISLRIRAVWSAPLLFTA